ncbi:hypothetical protein HDU97_003537 [Phlyctochytrium planicorne]|nr:hypothetical protein HDU97_003537 [Phlyctochytrium planicorne]
MDGFIRGAALKALQYQVAVNASQQDARSTNASTSIKLPNISSIQLELASSDKIANLWAGYGSIHRHTFRVAGPDTGKEKDKKSKKRDASTLTSGSWPSQISVVSKSVNAPVVKGMASVSHRRKLRSYDNEIKFYGIVKDALEDSEMKGKKDLVNPISSNFLKECPLPIPLHLSKPDPTTFYFVLSDLTITHPLGSDAVPDPLPLPHVKVVLTLLARFHAMFWESDLMSLPVWNGRGEIGGDVEEEEEGVGEDGFGLNARGSYWHLETRWEEWEGTGGKGLNGRLKSAALGVHQLLTYGRTFRGQEAREEIIGTRKYRTLVHGDCKLENLQFSKDPITASSEPSSTPHPCAFLDFQYTGTGLPARDLIYFISTSISANLLPSRRLPQDLLEFYRQQLPEWIRDQLSLETLERQCELAAVDFARFLVGWGTWGSWRWLQGVSEEVLGKVDGGKELKEEEYLVRLEAAFGRFCR